MALEQDWSFAICELQSHLYEIVEMIRCSAHYFS